MRRVQIDVGCLEVLSNSFWIRLKGNMLDKYLPNLVLTWFLAAQGHKHQRGIVGARQIQLSDGSLDSPVVLEPAFLHTPGGEQKDHSFHRQSQRCTRLALVARVVDAQINAIVNYPALNRHKH